MKEKIKRRIAMILFMLAVFGSSVACGLSGACYSQYPGCEATAAVIATAAAHGR